MNTTPEPAATPEQVSAILRDSGSPLYPSEITVYCDDCGATVTADYIVVDDMTGAERLECARAHLREDGWQCDADGDLCPGCTTTTTAAEGAQR